MRVALAQPRFSTLCLVKDLTKNTSLAFGSKKSWLQVDKAFKAPAYRGLLNVRQEQSYIQNLNILSPKIPNYHVCTILVLKMEVFKSIITLIGLKCTSAI